jgi:hypothetical protein
MIAHVPNQAMITCQLESILSTYSSRASVSQNFLNYSKPTIVTLELSWRGG